MARVVTLGALVTRLEQRADIENDQHFSTSEKKTLINEGLTDLYDELVTAAPPDYYLKDHTFTTTGSESGYALPSDFYKLRRVQIATSGRRRSLLPMQPDERVVMSTSNGASMVVEYIPVCTVLEDDSDTFDGVNGWEEAVVLWAAVKVFQKKRLPIGELAGQYQAMLQRIRANGYQDPGSPPMMQRASLRSAVWPWAGSGNTATHYRLRGLGATKTLEVWCKNYLPGGIP
jgi:hypothetical protein